MLFLRYLIMQVVGEYSYERQFRENVRRLVVRKRSISQGLETFPSAPYKSGSVLVYDMESKGVPFFETAYGMEEEPLICNPKRISIVQN